MMAITEKLTADIEKNDSEILQENNLNSNFEYQVVKLLTEIKNNTLK